MKYIKYLLALLLCSFALFQHLSDLPVRLWDESRLAGNAFEMFKSGNYLVTTFWDTPDLWNTKPPLMIWLQVISMHLVGINELALRLPSAVAGLFTCWVIFQFCNKHLKSNVLGLISVLVLVTCRGYISEHCTRSGDYDALFTLFTTLCIINFYYYLRYSDNKFLYYTLISFTFAALTKGIASFLILPGLFICSLYAGKTVQILKNKHFYWGFGIFILVIGGFYFFREMASAGYIKACIENDITGRFMKVSDEHKTNFWYYLNNFISYRLEYWLYVIPLSLICLFWKEKTFKNSYIYLLISSLCFFLVISISKTRIIWYDAPIYPLFSLMIGLIIYKIYLMIYHWETHQLKNKWNIISAIFIMFVFAVPYYNTIKYNYLAKDWDLENYGMGMMWQKALKNEINLNGYYVCENGYEPINKFYRQVYNDKGHHVENLPFDKLHPTEQIVFGHQVILDYVKAHYNFRVIYQFENVYFCIIDGEINPEKANN